MIDKELSSLLHSLPAEGISYAEIYAEESTLFHIFYEDRRVEPIATSIEKGYGLRFFRNEEVYYFSTSVKEELKTLVEKVLKKRVTPLKPLSQLPPRRTAFPTLKKPPETISREEKITLLVNAENQARKVGEEISQVSLHYGEKKKKIWFVSTTGDAYEEERPYLVFSVDVVAKCGNLLQTASAIMGGLCGWEIFGRGNLEVYSLVEKVAKRAKAKLFAPKAPVGEMPVVFSSSAGGTMIHEAIGHSLEADSVQKGISPVYQGKIGQKVASELVTVIDDPTLPNKNGSYIFDDEGTFAEKTVLIENGILKNYLYDRYTATKEKLSSNAHGRRESYHCKPIPRMSNTYILSGKDNPEEIIHSIEQGLLVKKMGGGQVNTATGDFVFEVEEGYLIKDRQIGPLVRGAVLLGNGPEVLQSIDLLGNDLGWSIGICGKDGQGVPVSDGLPTLRIKKLLVGGVQKT